MRFPFPLGRTSFLPHFCTCSGSARAGIVCTLAIALIGMGPHGPASQQPHYRTGIDLVALNVTVLDPQGRPIGGLTRDDFVVYEDGVQQDLSYFQSSDLPTDLVLLIDTSTSMSNRLAFVRKTAAEFARALRPGDRGAVFDFNNYLTVKQPLTDDIASLTRVIESTRASGATAVFDAIYIAMRELAHAPDPQGRVRRQIIVVLTDGDDNASLVNFDTLSEEVERRDVTIYTICPQDAPVEDDVWYHRRRMRQPRTPGYSMTWLARATGGAAYAPATLADLADAYQHIGREMAAQYLLGYVSTNRPAPGGRRYVNIQVRRPAGARPRTRSAYIG
jgi:Ca-activated chloride channel family protein